MCVLLVRYNLAAQSSLSYVHRKEEMIVQIVQYALLCAIDW